MATKAEIKLLRDTIGLCRDKTGRVRPEIVVKAAQRKKTAGEQLLHSKFDWDLHSAAMETWLERARELIREVKLVVVYDDVKMTAPYYVSDPSSKGSAYIETASIAKTEDIAEEVLRDELQRIEAAIGRARSVARVFELLPHFETLLRTIVEMKRRLDNLEKEKA